MMFNGTFASTNVDCSRQFLTKYHCVVETNGDRDTLLSGSYNFIHVERNTPVIPVSARLSITGGSSEKTRASVKTGVACKIVRENGKKGLSCR